MTRATSQSTGTDITGLDLPTSPLGRHILFVDDYPVHQQMVERMLKYAGFEVSTAASAVIMDIILRDGVVPDMFILDLMLPGEDGVSILRRLRKDPRFVNTPIIVLTAYKLRPREARRLGFNGYIRKPLDMANFTRTIKKFFKDMD
ncbi:MAG TPA: response regulator [Candidatus Dormibacteraeota bacterium]|nr:response regulator [Candidatus Dormibacteraeota bacterium]